MELMHNYQVSFKELLTEKFDYIIAASGYHKRSTFLSENISFGNAAKMVITFDEPDNKELRTENDKVFEMFGFNSVKTPPTETAAIERLMQKVCSGKICHNLNVLIDYSCMPKIWCASIVEHLLKNDFQVSRINIFFSYTPKKNNVLSRRSDFKAFEPMFSQYDNISGNKPVALVTGLNNNREIVRELIERLKPAETAAFIPEFSHDSEYYPAIVENNAPILKNIASDKVFRYPAQRPDQISSMLTSLCLDLRLNSNVILVPHGPKTLSLAAILLSVRYPDIKIYDLQSKDEKCDFEIGLPSGEPVILKSVFVRDDDDNDDDL